MKRDKEAAPLLALLQMDRELWKRLKPLFDRKKRKKK